MGLRIGSETNSLRSLQGISRRELETFERLASGLRINRGSDDPSGLVIFQQLRSELASINQAVENTQNANNMVQTAEGGLQQVSDLLVQARSLATQAMNSGAVGPQQRQALQNSMNNVLDAIDRIAGTTRYAGAPLLNGNLDFTLNNVDPNLTNVDVRGGLFEGGFPATVNVNVVQAATRAQANGTIAAVQTNGSKIRITGPLGSQDIAIEAGATQNDVETAINNVKEYTGVAASGGVIRSEEYGSDAFVDINELEGNIEGITPGRTTGADIVAQVNGENGSGKGNVVTVNTTALDARISVKPETAGQMTFTITGGGATFHLGTSATGNDRITVGVASASTENLGESGNIGSLSTLRTGAGNDILANPENALKVISAAADEVADQRGRLGSLSSRIFEANINALDVAYENVNASASTIADANMAEEITAMIRNRIVKEAGMQVIRQMNLNAGLALRLLGNNA